MKVQIEFKGGPLDGLVRTETVSEHWDRLRIDKRIAEATHVYYGLLSPMPRGQPTLMSYQGAERAGGTS